MTLAVLVLCCALFSFSESSSSPPSNPFPNGIDLSQDQQEFTFKSSTFKLSIPGGPSFILPPGYQLPPDVMAQLQAQAAQSSSAAPPAQALQPTPSALLPPPVTKPQQKPPIPTPIPHAAPAPKPKHPAATEYYGESGGYAGYGVRRYGAGNSNGRNAPPALASNDY
ncbi:cyclin-dependent kinase inhibitor 1C-like [Paramacrobiotus metropolitanus]|uniref:cyclin-dependent kinase inhibitor 1C-like n=1 Tax=Paramacrobiotus metropolitanus TaxID=2943436 RepID=UPI002446061F|nr:cyclin-dependent kinase inhibitor 1C-like [Paramacrobiotus metropolitanus]